MKYVQNLSQTGSQHFCLVAKSANAIIGLDEIDTPPTKESMHHKVGDLDEKQTQTKVTTASMVDFQEMPLTPQQQSLQRNQIAEIQDAEDDTCCCCFKQSKISDKSPKDHIDTAVETSMHDPLLFKNK